MEIKRSDLSGTVLRQAYEVVHGIKAPKTMCLSEVASMVMFEWKGRKFFGKKQEKIARKALFMIAGMSLPKVSKRAASLVTEFIDELVDVLPAEIMACSREAQDMHRLLLKYEHVIEIC
ncbi:MAG: hypothetical protein Q8R26_02620 [bacterium]|nr:hypothetical protein [bacterium]